MVTSSARDPETYAIIGAAMAVHTELGCGFLEAVYKAALSIELTDRSIPFCPEVPLPIFYKTRRLPLGYRVDFVCFDSALIEVKALPSLGAIEAAQAINYLRASGQQRGLILNLGAASLQYRRIVWDTARGRWFARPAAAAAVAQCATGRTSGATRPMNDIPSASSASSAQSADPTVSCAIPPYRRNPALSA